MGAETDCGECVQVTADVIDRRKASVAEKRASEGRVSRERSRRREESSDSEADVDFRLDPRDNTFRDVSLLPHTPSLSLVPAPWQKSPVGNSARCPLFAPPPPRAARLTSLCRPHSQAGVQPSLSALHPPDRSRFLAQQSTCSRSALWLQSLSEHAERRC
eukprot:3546343-Rhodomonas_salina.1